jgi:acyl phosphate:glycerol-3-phosphate acyltransferase
LDTGVVVGVVAVAYLLGSIPVAVVVGHRHGVELRSVGDRNPGYWNARSVLGRRAAVPVFIGDVAKGSLAVLLAMAASDTWWVGYLAAGAAMLGHAFPVFSHFRGGRSVLTFVGAAIVLSPIAAAWCIALCLLVSIVTRRFAWGARAGVFGFPIVQALFEPRAQVAATGALMCIIGARFAAAALHKRGSRPSAFDQTPRDS